MLILKLFSSLEICDIFLLLLAEFEVLCDDEIIMNTVLKLAYQMGTVLPYTYVTIELPG